MDVLSIFILQVYFFIIFLFRCVNIILIFSTNKIQLVKKMSQLPTYYPYIRDSHNIRGKIPNLEDVKKATNKRIGIDTPTQGQVCFPYWDRWGARPEDFRRRAPSGIHNKDMFHFEPGEPPYF